MRKVSSRPNREKQKEEYRRKKKEWKQLSKKLRAEGKPAPPRPTINNCKSHLETKQEEQEERQTVVEKKIAVYRNMLPGILQKLEKIVDPRNPKKLKHKLAVLLLYGILMFVYNMSSRRESTREMTRPAFMESLKAMFPEIDNLPHHDTLNRILSEIEVMGIEQVIPATIKQFIKNKKFNRYLINKQYMIAIDGTQKMKRDYKWAPNCQERKHKNNKKEYTTYYVYVLEATLVFNNGMTLPLFTEFLDNEGDQKLIDKQDCEIVAFKRLAARMKQTFSKLSIMVLLDGLYPNGPIIELCRKMNWDFMMVLQDGSLSTVWKEAEAIKKIEGHGEKKQNYNGREQEIWWVNEIEYCYGPNNRKVQKVNIVVCNESWEEIDIKTGKTIDKTSKHAWISNRPITSINVHTRCNLQARYRWSIENNILMEKHKGYKYTHCFSYNWNAMKGFHYLMKIAHMINEIALYTIGLEDKVKEMGKIGLIKYVRDTIAGNWLDYDRIKEVVNSKPQLRMI